MKQQYKPLSAEVLLAIKEGDVIERMLGFCIPVYLIVQKVDEDIIDCGWTFDRKTGLEVDEDIATTVSYISRVLTDEDKAVLDAGGKLQPL
jgi:hypothetical protein